MKEKIKNFLFSHLYVWRRKYKKINIFTIFFLGGGGGGINNYVFTPVFGGERIEFFLIYTPVLEREGNIFQAMQVAWLIFSSVWKRHIRARQGNSINQL